MSDNQELYHYGVLGMRWGIRKANKKGTTYTYKSYGQKKYEKRLEKQTKKGSDSITIKKTQNKLEHLRRRDKNRQTFAENTTTGKAIVRGLLYGPFGAGQYNRLRASGSGHLAARETMKKMAKEYGPIKRIIMSRDEEFKSAR